ncbi:hypothetical protein LMG26684_03765 [Achromobacter mucicolens]|uniref:hypothetical protein n=1 Tax=Achromobacter mucicolens TaxID=1389922 RepID=UPI0014682B52|nr:hypothetical protein [Achromobacter mucicolens]CAB3884598.1 hypothetical protein LMG26684_03765 [Achromobacter mucicolens]
MRYTVLLAAVLATCAHAQFPTTGLGTPNSTDKREMVAQAQEYWRSITQSVLGNSRNLVVPTLSAHDRAIEGKIIYRVVASGDFNAAAYVDGGRRYVRLRSTSAQAFGWIAEAEVMGAETNNEKCFLAYMMYFATNTIHNSNVFRGGSGSPKLTFAPLLAVQRGLLPECNAGFNVYKNIVHQQWPFISRQAEGALMLLWLHEVAHHVLGHVQDPNASLAIRRQRESAADEWAIQAMTNANQFATVGRPFFYLISVFQGMSLAEEQASTHPLGARRARDIFAAIAPSVRANPKLMSFLQQEPGREAEYFKELSAMQKQASSMIPTK